MKPFLVVYTATAGKVKLEDKITVFAKTPEEAKAQVEIILKSNSYLKMPYEDHYAIVPTGTIKIGKIK